MSKKTTNFEQRKKTNDGGPVLKRDANNKLDMDAAAQETQRLMQKLLQEERMHKKDISFNAHGSKRDFVVMVTVMQRNTVDGKIVIGEDERTGFEQMDARDPYKYKIYDFVEAPIMARDIPMSKTQTGRQMMGVFNTLIQYLAKLSIIDRV